MPFTKRLLLHWAQSSEYNIPRIIPCGKPQRRKILDDLFPYTRYVWVFKIISYLNTNLYCVMNQVVIGFRVSQCHGVRILGCQGVEMTMSSLHLPSKVYLVLCDHSQ